MILNSLFKGNTLYYPGCLTKVVAKDPPSLKLRRASLLKNYRNILRKLGIEFIELADLEACCGSPVLNAGESKEFKRLAEKNLEVFKSHGVDRIITSCPACFKVLSKDYPTLLGDKWDIKVEHIVVLIAKAVDEGPLRLPQGKRLKLKKQDLSITYHDPCHLGRHCGIYDEPRKIIEAITGSFREMRLNREEAYCCGGGGGVRSNFPKRAKRAAEQRAGMAKEVKADVLVTSCPMCYLHLKESAKGKNVRVMEISELVVGQMRAGLSD